MTIYRSDREQEARTVAVLLEVLHGRYVSNAAQVRSQSPLTTLAINAKLPGIVTERDILAAFNDAYGANGTNWFMSQAQYGPTYQTALTSAIASLNAIIAYITTTMAGYLPVAAISDTDRDAIADTIEAELEA